jgi:iron complex outermembrane receptor protein
MSKRRSLRLGLLAGVVVPLAGLATLAHAADAPPDPNQSSQLGEVVVTATRQEQALSKVPVSVSAFTEQKMDIQGVKSFADISRYTPGVTFAPDSKDIAIRGVSSGAGAGTTGIYIDDTPIQMRSIGFVANNTLPGVFDLDRVEVLRGPQGTLFGAGSEGGTVRYITPQPSLTHYSAYVRAEGSGTQGGGGSGELGVAVGGPIVQDKLGFRASAWYRRDGGYVDRVDQATDATVAKDANSTDTFAARVAMTWKPIDDLTITPSVYYQSRVQNDTDAFWKGISDLNGGVFNNGDPESLPDKDRYTLSSVKAQYDFSGVSVISNTSYFTRHEVTGYEGTLYNLSYFQQLIGNQSSAYPLLTPTGFNLPGFGRYSSPNTVTNRQNNFTQELRIQSTNPDQRINWVAGVFYQNNETISSEEIHDPQLEAITQYLFGQSAEDYWGEGLLPQYGDDDYINHTVAHDRQIAGFLDVTVAITHQLKLEGGLRYAQTHFDFVNFGDGAQNFGRTDGAGQETEYPLTPKGSIQFQADDNNLFYATYSRGYREGGANPPIPFAACASDLSQLGLSSSPDKYASDWVDSYEIGSKNKFLDRTLQLDTSVYYLKWSGIQESVPLPGCGFQFTGNLGQAESKGFDFQGQYTIGPIVAEAAIGYTDAHYTQTLTSGDAVLVNKGDAIPNVSPWTVALGAQYNFELNGHQAFARFDDEYTSQQTRLTAATDPDTHSYDAGLVLPSATNFLSLRAGVLVGGANVSLFVDNVANALPQLTLSHEDKYTLLYTQTTFRPRTMGVTATYRY